jgi:excisionase family DNA binding protein
MGKEERLQRYKEARRNPKGPAKRLYSISEAAFYLGRSVDSLRELIWAGKVPYIKDGKRIYLDVRDIDAYIERTKRQFTY